MASENPPIAPAASAQRMLARSGNGPCWARATVVIRTKAHTCENAVKTKALTRREANPPAKSAAPQRKTAVTEYAAGPSWGSAVTTHESNMLKIYKEIDSSAYDTLTSPLWRLL